MTEVEGFAYRLAQYGVLGGTASMARDYVCCNAGMLSCLGESPSVSCGYVVMVLVLLGVTGQK